MSAPFARGAPGTNANAPRTRRRRGFQRFIRGSSQSNLPARLISQRTEQRVPKSVNKRVNDRGGENRSRLAPSPPIEKSGDGRKNDVTPIRKSPVGDMREAKQQRSGPPTRQVAPGRARQHTLQQAAKQEFFRPGRKEEDRQCCEGKRSPRTPVRSEGDEVQRLTKENGDSREDREVSEDEETPVAAPSNA